MPIIVGKFSKVQNKDFMSYSKRKIFFNKEILINNLGQIRFKSRFFYKNIIKFYRFI